MPKVSINVGLKEYEIFCKAGSEGKILLAATKFDKDVQELKKVLPSFSNEQLFLIAALKLQNEMDSGTSSSTDNKIGTVELEESLKAINKSLDLLAKK